MEYFEFISSTLPANVIRVKEEPYAPAYTQWQRKLSKHENSWIILWRYSFWGALVANYWGSWGGFEVYSVIPGCFSIRFQAERWISPDCIYANFDTWVRLDMLSIGTGRRSYKGQQFLVVFNYRIWARMRPFRFSGNERNDKKLEIINILVWVQVLSALEGVVTIAGELEVVENSNSNAQ